MYKGNEKRYEEWLSSCHQLIENLAHMSFLNLHPLLAPFF